VAPVVPWWRQAPAWALAAAASVMFLAGGAGGALASRWLPQSPARAEVATVPANAPGVTSAELSQAEQRILQLMRLELSGMDQRVRLVASQPSPRVNASLSTSAPGGQAQSVAAASDDHQELLTLITQAWNDFVTQQNQNKEQYQRLVRELADLRANSGGLNR
jgi:alpha-beta hydrolase superfamily lysophospholipase